MGASVFQHGWRNLPRDVWSNVAGNSPRMFGGLGGLSGLGGAGRDSGAWSSEWRQISDPFNDARERAVGRLRLEAEAAGADAVLGVRLRRTGRAFAGEGTVEFTAVGTAVRLPEALRTGAVVSTDLSGQDYVNLARAGCRPVGLIGQTTATYVASSYGQGRVIGSGNSLFSIAGRTNQELTDFTQGFYAARTAAVRDLSRHARELGADGVVGVEIDEEIHPREYEDANHNTHHDLIVIIHMLGTAITDGHPELPGPAPSLAVPLSYRAV
jgi:uncharacterized protein YbjQ (UPF0145 family)